MNKLELILNQESHLSMSEKYSHIKTSDVLKELETSGWRIRDIQAARVVKKSKEGFQKHIVRLTNPDLRFNRKDIVPELVVVNSYDSTSSLQILLGVYRLVCSNGLLSGTTFDAYRMKHVGDIETRYKSRIADLVASIPRLESDINRMSLVLLSDSQQVEFAEKAIVDILGKSTEKIDPRRLLIARRFDDQGPDVFTVYNRIQENVIHGLFRNGRRITSASRNVKINRELWDLAQTFTERKVA